VGPEDLTRKIIKGKISFDEEGNLKVDFDLTRSGMNLARLYDTNGKLLVEISILSLLRNYETNTTTIGHDSTFTIPKQSLPGGDIVEYLAVVVPNEKTLQKGAQMGRTVEFDSYKEKCRRTQLCGNSTPNSSFR
jgi:hypothetical protein